MIFAMIRVMALSLFRDRGALAMSFLLPPTIFVIFAAIFSGTTGGELHLRVAFGVTQQSAFAKRFETAMRTEPSLRILKGTTSDEKQVIALVKSGQADIGLLVQGNFTDTTSAPVAVFVDSGKIVAAGILSAEVQQLIASALPDVGLARTAPTVEALVGGFTPEQAARLAAQISYLGNNRRAETAQSGLLETRMIGPGKGASATVTYYAGAVAILFLLFSAMQNGATLIEERNLGIMDRIAVGPGSTDVMVLAKFLFLLAQGTVQASLIFAIAALLYHVDILAHIWLWLLTTLAAAAAAAGLGLCVAAACTTRQQAQTISTFLVLVCSAVGGSMVPRFMMPAWLQDAGWYTPNAWAIEAYHGVLWRGQGLADLFPELTWLFATALAGASFAMVLSRIRLRL